MFPSASLKFAARSAVCPLACLSFGRLVRSAIAAWLILATVSSSSYAQQVKPELVVEGLNNPTSVAVQPETGTVFVAESGAGRIVRILDGQAQPVIVDFPLDTYGKGPVFDIGPLSLLFLDETTLVVGGGGKPDGEDVMRVFKVPAADAKPISASDIQGDQLALPPMEGKPGEGNFYALAKGNSGIYVTCNGDDKKGWIAMATLNENQLLTSFQRKIATVEAIRQTAPVAITVSPQGHIVVGQMGPVEDQTDSQLSFYSEAGALLDNFPLGLHDVSGLAYGPRHGRLFATDFRWTDPAKGGLYKIVATEDDAGCKPVTLAVLDAPTSLGFSNKGDLYVTLAGNPAQAKEGKPNGKLVLFKDLDTDNRKK